ncbi:MAG: dTMP kinase [Bacteroidales bacterium]
MRFLVIEGLDGSGKSTQVNLLRSFLEKASVRFKYLHFPRLEEGVYGKLIARFLRGEMGDIDRVDPYLVALIFAGDRMEAKPIIEQWIEQDYLVILDRYVYSNIAFQGAKFADENEQLRLADWIMNLEFNFHKLPVPDVNVYLDVPFSFTKKLLTGQRKGDERGYLKGQHDIHENDLEFQKKVHDIYHSVCSKLGNLEVVNCANDLGEMKREEEIFESLKEVLGYG